jgi:RNA polymerase sigma-70 factor (ECF subfamily)
MRPEYREAIVLFHDHQMSYEEIAEVMNRPLGTIKTWIRRARGELIDQLRSREVLPESRNALRPV